MVDWGFTSWGAWSRGHGVARETGGRDGILSMDAHVAGLRPWLARPPAPLSVSSPDVDMMRQSTQRAETSGARRMPAGMGRHNRARKACRVG